MASRMRKMNRPTGMGWRVGASIVCFFGTIIALLVWSFFLSGGYSTYQNIVAVLVIVLTFMAIMGAVWASWGMKQAMLYNRTGRRA